MSFDDVYDNPTLFEAEHQATSLDLTFWGSIVSKLKPKCILDVGCGTGRIACEIIDQVDYYCGIDLSKEFIEYFKSINNNSKAEIVNGDIFDYDFSCKFNCIILPENFIAQIESSTLLEVLFKRLGNFLDNDGVIVVDYYNPQLRFLDNKIEDIHCYDFIYENELISTFETHKYNALKQINLIERKYYLNNKLIKKSKLPIRVYFPRELEYIIKKSNLKIKNKFGDYNFNEVNEFSPQLIYCLEHSS